MEFDLLKHANNSMNEMQKIAESFGYRTIEDFKHSHDEIEVDKSQLKEPLSEVSAAAMGRANELDFTQSARTDQEKADQEQIANRILQTNTKPKQRQIDKREPQSHDIVTRSTKMFGDESFVIIGPGKEPGSFRARMLRSNAMDKYKKDPTKQYFLFYQNEMTPVQQGKDGKIQWKKG